MAMNEVLCVPYAFSGVTASSTQGSRVAANVGNDRLGRSWGPSATSSQYIIVDLGSVKPVDTIALLATNGTTGTLVATSLGDGSTPNPTTTVGSGTVAFVPNNAKFNTPTCQKRLHRNCVTLLEAPINARYVKVWLSGHPASFVIGRIVVGKRYTALDTMDIGFSHRVIDYGENKITSTALETANIQPKVLEHNWAWTWMTEQEARGDLLDIMAYAGQTKDVLCVLNPDAEDLHNVIGYGRFAQITDLINVAGGSVANAWQAKFTLRSRLILNL